jgi:cellulose synthase/poly-beta-1,6-N-acetylglucosamine synthase-like glycosyltransferase
MVCQILFWTSVALLAYTFLGYQILIHLLAGLRHRPKPGLSNPPERATVLIVAHNEEARIGARIENLRASAVPVDIAVCSDGSSDATAAQARLAGARVFDFPLRRGKAACLSEAIPALETPIVILADSRQQFTPETIARLLRHFADPAVGAVSGILRIGEAGTSAGSGVDLYWKMETAVRQSESNFDSCIGCTGAVYAIRRSLFRPIPADTILDDVVIPMEIAVSGHRVVYDSEAEAFDPQPLDPRAETRRKSRTLAGNFQMLLRHPAWLLPWRNRLAFQLISHKYLRLAGPLLLLLALASSACLYSIPLYRASLGLQFLLYLLATAGLALPSLRARLFSIPAGFLFLNLMTLRGFLRFFFGPKGVNSAAWEKPPFAGPPARLSVAAESIEPHRPK